MQTQLIDIDLCVEEPLNPRYISDDLLKNLAEKIKNEPEFFGAVPCLAYELKGKYYIYSGAQRLKASRILGLKQIPVRVADDMVKKGKVNMDLLKSRILKANEEASTIDYEILANIAPIQHIIEANIPEISSYIENISPQEGVIDEDDGIERHETISENMNEEESGILGVTLEFSEPDYIETMNIFEELRGEDESISEFVLGNLRAIWAKK